MRERPILFSSPMVRALLDGTKTQTRRVVSARHLAQIDLSRAPCRANWSKPMPYGDTGDRLWVRETWSYRCTASTPTAGQYMHTIGYLADDARQTFGPMPDDGVGLPVQRATVVGEPWQERQAYLERYWRQWRPSIHMPRWASRITLEVTGVRVERLQDIRPRDILAEGAVERPHVDQFGRNPVSRFDGKVYLDLRSLWAAGWNQINGPGSWGANPWVWVIEFRRT